MLLCNPLKLYLIITVDFLKRTTFLILFNIHAALSVSQTSDTGTDFHFFLWLVEESGGFSALLRNLSGASCLTQISCLHSSSTGLRRRRGGGWEGDPIAMTTDVCISCGQTHRPRPLDRRVAAGRREVERGLRVIKRSK